MGNGQSATKIYEKPALYNCVDLSNGKGWQKLQEQASVYRGDNIFATRMDCPFRVRDASGNVIEGRTGQFLVQRGKGRGRTFEIQDEVFGQEVIEKNMVFIDSFRIEDKFRARVSRDLDKAVAAASRTD